jgi:hypothetical protein
MSIKLITSYHQHYTTYYSDFSGFIIAWLHSLATWPPSLGYRTDVYRWYGSYGGVAAPPVWMLALTAAYGSAYCIVLDTSGCGWV